MSRPDAAAAPAATRLPREGVKVVDVATLAAGPWLATRLPDVGADVIKVEHPSAGDPPRTCDVFPRLTKTPGAVRHLSPRPGSDTGEVLAALGYTDEEIQGLRDMKVA